MRSGKQGKESALAERMSPHGFEFVGHHERGQPGLVKGIIPYALYGMRQVQFRQVEVGKGKVANGRKGSVECDNAHVATVRVRYYLMPELGRVHIDLEAASGLVTDNVLGQVFRVQLSAIADEGGNAAHLGAQHDYVLVRGPENRSC